MLILDIKKSVPLDPCCLDWNPDHITTQEMESGPILTVPLLDETLREEAKRFACNIAASQPWTWPDHEKTTVALFVDATRPYPRFALRVGVQPAPITDEEAPAEWAVFEEQRQEAIRRHEQGGGCEIADTFPVMLTGKEEETVRHMLFTHMGIY